MPSLVSVCIPAFNAATTIGATLDSLLAQDYPRIEIVVSDNRSTDHTRAIVQSYADRGVRYVRHERPRPEWANDAPDYVGGFLNWEHALSCGKGEYLCLYHADDLFAADMISTEVDLMRRHPAAAAVFTMAQMIDGDGRPIHGAVISVPKPLRGKEIFEFPELLNGILQFKNFLAAPSVMLRASLLPSFGHFDERRCQSSADLEMWLRIARRYPIGVVPKPLLKYRVHERQWSARYSHMQTAKADFFVVMDNILNEPEVASLAGPESLNRYLVEKSIDEVLCSVHLLTSNRVDEARSRLRNALGLSRLRSSIIQPRRLLRLLVGYALLGSIRLHVGMPVGRWVHRLSRVSIHRLLRRLKRRSIDP